MKIQRKTCSKCGKKKWPSQFPIDKQKSDGHYSSCRDCHRQWYLTHPQKKLINTKRKLATYGLSLEKYEKMVKAQKGKCAICGEVDKNGRRLAVDHNHKTDEVRALLCSSCNFLIGTCQESIEVLKSAIKYLEKYND